MQKKIIWGLVALVLIAAPAVIGLIALGGNDSSSEARRAGALVAPGTGGYELTIANLLPTGQAMQLVSYSWGGSAPVALVSGSLTRSGAAKTTELSITKKIDSASPLLMKGLVQGTRYPSATLTLYKGGERAAKYMEYKLTNVFISAVQHGGAADEVPAENVSFAFESLETVYDGKASGGEEPTTQYLWNVSGLKQ